MRLLLMFALLLPWQEKPPEKGAVSGVVVDSVTGAGLAKAHVYLEPLDQDLRREAGTTSDAKGQFALADLEPGRYRLRASRNGYLNMAYGEKRPWAGGVTLQVDAGQTISGLRFELPPGGVIAGIVRDRDGEPQQHSQVILGRMAYQRGAHELRHAAETMTNDRGEYRVSGLPAGKYYVAAGVNGAVPVNDHSAGQRPEERDVPTAYPGVSDPNLATAITLTTGQKAESIDITLVRSRVYRVRGRVLHAPPGVPPRIYLNLPRGWLPNNYVESAPRNADGDFEIDNVATGSYQLGVNAGSLWGETEITVGSADLDGVSVTVGSGITIPVSVGWDGDPKPLTNLAEFILAGEREMRGGFPKADGSFAFTDVHPGLFRLQLNMRMPGEFYVKEARGGSVNVLDDGLKVGEAGAPKISITLAAGVGSASGVVRDKDAKPVSGAMVVLAPEQRVRSDLFLYTTTDQNGRYEFTGVAPGQYKAFAWDDIEPWSWEDADVMRPFEKQGEKVTIGPNGRASVDLKLAVAEQ